MSMRLPDSAYHDRPWRIHEFTGDFLLEDVWSLPTPGGPDDLDRLVRDCEDAGVLITGGTEWFPAEPAGPFIRLNYAGPNPGAFPEGARIIGRVLERNRR